ncbi:MAG: hypothetical protein HC921_12865 [Synechococcaceae cyanobacterium SM2_3_1]|nr:hypothetical protein [Synechococcaceae cyanobacterium SM2_3_1]
MKTPTQTINYNYDLFRRLDQVRDPNLGETEFTYDDADRLVLAESPNGTREIRDYDVVNRLTEIRHENASGGILARYQYTLDAVGNRQKVEELNDREVDYEYDDLYRLTKETITDPILGNRVAQYSYDPFGNRLQKTDSVDGVTTYTYDANDRLQSEQQGIVTTYGYDDNGNQLSRQAGTDPADSFTWDRQNRLIGAQVQGLGAQYQYDVNGIRVRSTVNGQETRYLIDETRPYAQVIEESDPMGTVSGAYVYGHRLLSQKRGGTRNYYHEDGLGSQRLLTDGTGAVSDSYTYDAYGQLLGSTGSTPNLYRYAGEQLDPALNQYYLRARYYDPTVGRFTTRDQFEGLQEEPLSLNKYIYGSANPVNKVDPKGLFGALPSPATVAANQVAAATLHQAILATAYAIVFAQFQTLEGAKLVPLSVIQADQRFANIARKPISIGAINTLLTESYSLEREVASSPFGLKTRYRSIPVLVWGIEYGKTFSHTLLALLGMGNTKDGGKAPPLLLRISPEWERGSPPWYSKFAPCDQSIPGDKLSCDEYPYASSLQGGKLNYQVNRVSISLVPEKEQSHQGANLKASLNKALVVSNDRAKGWYGVLANPHSIRSYWFNLGTQQFEQMPPVSLYFP